MRRPVSNQGRRKEDKVEFAISLTATPLEQLQSGVTYNVLTKPNLKRRWRLEDTVATASSRPPLAEMINFLPAKRQSEDSELYYFPSLSSFQLDSRHSFRSRTIDDPTDLLVPPRQSVWLFTCNTNHTPPSLSPVRVICNISP